ncbi:hypothetical protein AB4114_10960 [Paenibacillus sp. 2RAB27]|uniref:hypothetical protein n=1 Tax=Paenibacillus sp. 2RAB27 TaxID=3232991 RepID=UPI003F973A47
MDKMKLLPYEVPIYEGIKAGKKISQIAGEQNEENGSTFARVKRMIDLGFMTREGQPKKYKYHVVDKPYVVVEIRKTEDINIPTFEDKYLNDLVNVSLSEENLRFLRENKDLLSRSQLAEKLGISKLELNQVMNKTGIVQKRKSNGDGT